MACEHDERSGPRRVLRATGWLALVFLPLDAVWLTLAGPRLYRPALDGLLAPQPDLWAAGLFYALYLLGLAVLVLRASEPGQWPSVRTAAWRGACFGLVAYATYDLTNQATLRGWPWHVTVIDLCWGAAATATACAMAAWGLVRGASRHP